MYQGAVFRAAPLILESILHQIRYGMANSGENPANSCDACLFFQSSRSISPPMRRSAPISPMRSPLNFILAVHKEQRDVRFGVVLENRIQKKGW